MKKWEDLEIFELAIKNASDHIIITDHDAVILYANEAVTKITGYRPEEIIGKTPRLWGGQMPEKFYKRFWKRLKIDKKPFIGEIRNKRKNGESYDAEIKIAPVLSKSGAVKYFVGIERDITRLKQIDRVKTEIISLTAHQLRDAPATIKIYAEALLRGTAGRLGKKQSQYVKEILAANRTNIDLIKALLNVARLELGTFRSEPQPVDVIKTAEDVIRSMSRSIKKGKLKIVEHYDKSLKPVILDPEGLRIILHNLISNACKYSPEGAVITVEIRPVTKRGKRKIWLKVEDTGYGIPRAEQAKIFTKMFRAENVRDKKTEGSGLGLYMVKLLLKQMKGSIRFRSREGKGTCFEVLIPPIKNGITRRKK